MTPEEIGVVYNQLVERRTLYSFSTPYRSRSAAEKQAVTILESQFGRLGDLEEFLETQGLRIVLLDAGALGIAPTGRIYVAVRAPELKAPSHLANEHIVQELIDERRGEAIAPAAIWSTYLFLQLMHFLYTSVGRSIESVSGYEDTWVDVDAMIEEVQRRIERLRSTPVDDSPDRQRIQEVLTRASEQTVEARVRSFFKSMERLGVLEEVSGVQARQVGQRIYRQSLWSAVDIANNFKRHAGALILPDVDAVETVAVQGESHSEGD